MYTSSNWEAVGGNPTEAFHTATRGPVFLNMAKYVVVPGDSLSAIAKRYGLSWQDLFNREENADFRDDHPNPDLIYPGEVLWVPDPPPAEKIEVRRRVNLTRTSPLEEHHTNSIATSYAIYLHVQLPMADCKAAPDTFTLSSAGASSYSRKASLKDDVVEIGGAPYLVFDGLVPDQKYDLTVEAPNVKPQKLIDSVPFTELLWERRHAPWHSDDLAAAKTEVRFSDYSFGPIFSPQPINLLGEGPFHVNRFRIYFRPTRWILTAGKVPLEQFPRTIELPVALASRSGLVKEFIRDFPVIFNGGREGILSDGIRSVSWMNVKGRRYWKHNMAQVVRHQLPGGQNVLGFEIDIQPLRVIFQKLLRECVKGVLMELALPIPFGALYPVVDPIVDKAFPIEQPEHPGTDPEGGILAFRQELTNAHADWVGVDMLDEGRGFAVQTLQRHQRDWASQRLVDLIDTALLPDDVKQEAHKQEEDKIELFNQFHFLAGRRSWVIGAANDPLAGDYISAPKTGVFFLETAAIERYSQAIHNEITSKDPGFAVEFREAVKTVWIRLLMNYVTANGFEVVPLDLGAGGWEKEADVSLRELSFLTQAAAEADPMTAEITRLHPTLAEQLHE